MLAPLPEQRTTAQRVQAVCASSLGLDQRYCPLQSQPDSPLRLLGWDNQILESSRGSTHRPIYNRGALGLRSMLVTVVC